MFTSTRCVFRDCRSASRSSRTRTFSQLSPLWCGRTSIKIAVDSTSRISSRSTAASSGLRQVNAGYVHTYQFATHGARHVSLERLLCGEAFHHVGREVHGRAGPLVGHEAHTRRHPVHRAARLHRGQRVHDEAQVPGLRGHVLRGHQDRDAEPVRSSSTRQLTGRSVSSSSSVSRSAPRWKKRPALARASRQHTVVARRHLRSAWLDLHCGSHDEFRSRNLPPTLSRDEREVRPSKAC